MKKCSVAQKVFESLVKRILSIFELLTLSLLGTDLHSHKTSFQYKTQIGKNDGHDVTWYYRSYQGPNKNFTYIGTIQFST